MIAHERRSRILALLAERKRAEFSELLDLSGTSPATLRRDLDFLEGKDLLVRVHGAVLHHSAALGEPSLVQKAGLAVAAKRRIGEFAASLVSAGATVFVDSGTTCLEVARVLRERPDLTLVTNSLAVVAGHELFKARLVVIGGERRALSGALVGPLATEAVEGLRADIAFVGASGLDPGSGPGTTELGEKQIKVGWVARSRRRVLLCDAGKWESAAAFLFARWADFTDFVTDRQPPRDFAPKKLNIHIS